MKVKRFRAANMTEALQMVKQDLGEEAVILKSEVIERSGFFDMMKKDKIEVVAAVDLTGKDSQIKPTEKRSKPMSNLSYFRDSDAGSRPQGRSKEQAEPVKPSKEFTKVLSNHMEQPNKAYSNMRSRTANRPQQSRVTSSVVSSKPESRRNRTADNDIRNMQDELKELRSMIKSVTGKASMLNDLSMREFADMPSAYADQVMNLIEKGVERHIAKTVVERAAAAVPVDSAHDPGALQSSIRKTIGSMIETAGPITCKKGKTKIIALVGPTGVGKTTTLAKLAANSKFVFKKNVALISADTYRMSAIEHLNTFAGIAHLPISAVYSPDELKASLKAQQDKDLIFIDTAGRSPRDKKFLLELKEFMDCAQPDEIHLVVPANITYMDLLETIRRFGVLSINRVIITKTDETVVTGSILNISSEVGNPLSYVTNGQTIPDDIELAKGDKLARLIMERA